MLAYLVREHKKTSQTRKIRKIRTKKTKNVDRSSEECDARRSERLQERHKCERGTDNCCTDETTRRRGRRYRHKAGGEAKIREHGEKHGKKNKTSRQDNKCHCYRFRAPPIECVGIIILAQNATLRWALSKRAIIPLPRGITPPQH